MLRSRRVVVAAAAVTAVVAAVCRGRRRRRAAGAGRIGSGGGVASPPSLAVPAFRPRRTARPDDVSRCRRRRAWRRRRRRRVRSRHGYRSIAFVASPLFSCCSDDDDDDDDDEKGRSRRPWRRQRVFFCLAFAFVLLLQVVPTFLSRERSTSTATFVLHFLSQ